uniref:Integrase, catalytic region, zinc finger, CCHC-type, peptidase aspartic, catalytic n=1 Tax=Tanacetum cinerariifolium TaxID=118510 RepID=A0A6L2MUG6_TANCI|nr:hypothetical protein [Tanacetum cinerariifolium]
MHNNIMAAGSRDRPPMLATGRYAQWQSRFLRYIDTRPNGDALRKCILQGPYTPTTVTILAVPAIDNSPAVPERTTTTHEMWIAIERLQQEVNEIRSERIAKNANPLALVAPAQPHSDPYYQAPKSHKSYAPTSKASTQTRSHAITRHKGKEIAKPFIPPSESASEEDSDPKQAQKDEDMKPKRVKDSTYHKEKMLLCKQAEKGVSLQVEQSNWLAETDEKIDEQELKAHYNFLEKIQEVPTTGSGTDTEPLEQVQYNTGYNVFATERQHFEQPESISNTCVVKKVDSNVIPDSLDTCDNDIQTDQNAVECDDERVALANLIANLKLDVDENKKIQKQLKKANTTLDHELTESKSILAETSRI